MNPWQEVGLDESATPMRYGVPTAAKRPSITRIDTLATSSCARQPCGGGHAQRPASSPGRAFTSQRLKAPGRTTGPPPAAGPVVSPEQLQPLLAVAPSGAAGGCRWFDRLGGARSHAARAALRSPRLAAPMC